MQNSQKEAAKAKSPRSKDNYSNRVSQTLVIGEGGRILSYHRIKRWLMVLLSLLFLCILVIAGMSYFYYQNEKSIASLHARIADLEEKSLGLKKEKELLMAESEILKAQLSPPIKAEEGKANAAKADSSKSHQAKSSALKNDGKKADGTANPDAANSDNKKKTSVPAKRVTKTVTEAQEIKEEVDVQKFKISHDEGRHRINVNYVVRNLTKANHLLSGRTMLVLSDPNAPKNKWISMPGVPLKDGKPAGKLGAVFRIRNFKTMKFASPELKPPYFFSDCTVYVFNQKGFPMLERSFPVAIKAEPEKPVELPDSKAMQLKGKELENPAPGNTSPPETQTPESTAPTPSPGDDGTNPNTPTSGTESTVVTPTPAEGVPTGTTPENIIPGTSPAGTGVPSGTGDGESVESGENTGATGSTETSDPSGTDTDNPPQTP